MDGERGRAGGAGDGDTGTAGGGGGAAPCFAGGADWETATSTLPRAVPGEGRDADVAAKGAGGRATTGLTTLGAGSDGTEGARVCLGEGGTAGAEGTCDEGKGTGTRLGGGG